MTAKKTTKPINPSDHEVRMRLEHWLREIEEYAKHPTGSSPGPLYEMAIGNARQEILDRIRTILGVAQ